MKRRQIQKTKPRPMAMELFARDSISSSECEGGQREILCAHSSNNDDKTGGYQEKKDADKKLVGLLGSYAQASERASRGNATVSEVE